MLGTGPVWRLLVDPPLPGPENMARDHALALSCGSTEAFLRFYTWDRPTLSLGRNEPARGVYLEERLASEGVGVVRRPTGGRAVLHHRELTYAVCVPARALGGARAAYAGINRALAVGLRQLGAPVSLAGPGRAWAPDAGPCFQAPAEGEVMAPGLSGEPAKLVGSAQARIGGALLQHGSILLRDDQRRIPEFLAAGGETGDRPAVLSRVLGREVALPELTEALAAGFADVLPGDWSAAAVTGRGGAGPLPEAPPFELLARYRSREWTWRR